MGCDDPRGEAADEPADHRPVLVEETMHALAIQPEGIYVDATFGRGGHARALLHRLGPRGRLFVCDRDPDAIAAAERLQRADPRLQWRAGPFSEVPDWLGGLGLKGRICGMLLDLGVSSPQLDAPERGFSFVHDGPLDMRMDPHSGEPVAAWLGHASVAEIARVLHDYGEERFANRIARAIVRERLQSPLVTTRQLAALIERTIPTREPGKHPATRTFQALRIRVNRELDELSAFLRGVTDLLTTGGRLAVISFHSLEDRIVKRFIRDQARGARLPKSVPVQGSEERGAVRAVGSLIRPSEQEIAANPRARSAILRVAERLA